MRTDLRGQSVVITGASSGIGAAAAECFAREGARLFLGARRLDRLKRVATAALAAGAAEAHVRRLDVSRAASVRAFTDWVTARCTSLAVLVNNAGGAHGLDPVAEGQDPDWERMLQTNVLGLLRMTRALLPRLTSQPGSTVINVGSVAGRTAYEGGSAYCAAKAGELQITRALRLETCGTGLRVGTIDPGMVETEFSLVRFKGDAEKAARVYRGVTPLEAADVAEAMVWMASRPPHVCIDEILIQPTAQASVHKVHRRE